MTQNRAWLLAATVLLLPKGADAPRRAVEPRPHQAAVYEIRLVHDHDAETFRFIPDQVTARPGDVLLFRVVNGEPHNIGLASDGLSPRVRALWNAALPDRVGDLRGPLLTHAGDRYRVVVPPVPAGTYRFYCLSHRAYEESGVVKVVYGGKAGGR